MSLIDADKEIEKLEEKIESIKEELKWLHTNKPDLKFSSIMQKN